MYGVAQEINHYEVIRNNWKEMLGSEILKKSMAFTREVAKGGRQAAHCDFGN